MSGLRLEIDLEKVGHNARVLVDRAARRGVTITAVTKVMLGSPELAHVLLAAGVRALADSRIDNAERMREAGVKEDMWLVRSPMASQVDRVVRSGVMSVNTEIDVLSALGTAARIMGRTHDVLIMVELGDLREGVMADQLGATIRHVLGLSTLRFCGIGANLACRNGVEPSVENMAALSAMVNSVEDTLGVSVGIVSGGNSANLDWAFGPSELGRINNLRLGEAIMLGREPLGRSAIAGLHTNAFTLVAEVIESKCKPTKPWGQSGQNSFGEVAVVEDRGNIWQTILAVGRQDTDTSDLTVDASASSGVSILAASSDHLITETQTQMCPGDEVRFEPGYSALLRSMTSPLVAKREVFPEPGLL